MSEIRTRLPVGADEGDEARKVRQSILDDIDVIERKPFNSNSHHSLPVRPDVVDEIRHRMMGSYGMSLGDMPTPYVALNSDGTVSLTFAIHPRTLTINVLCGRVVQFRGRRQHGYAIDGLIKLPLGSPATGYAVEIDEVTDWLLKELQADE